MKILPVGAQFYAEGKTDRHDEARSHVSQFCERAEKHKHKEEETRGWNTSARIDNMVFSLQSAAVCSL